MPKNPIVTQERSKGGVRREQTSSQVSNEYPHGAIKDFEPELYETVNSVITVGAWMGSPFITYTVAQTVTFTQPKGGRFG